MPDNPWRFLTPLSATNAEDRRLIEQTRSDELHLINHLIASSRVSLLYSYSGNGKTSLIDAGVTPFFRREGYAVFRTRPRPPWSQANPVLAFKDCVARDLPSAFFSGKDKRLLTQLLAAAAEKQVDQEHEELKRLLQRVEKILATAPDESMDRSLALLPDYTSMSLAEFSGVVSELLGPERRLLLICDQFEELFVHYGNSIALEQFVEELGEMWAKDSLPLHLLFSLREDWVGSMIAFRRTIPEIFRNYFRLGPLTAKRADEILTLPFASFDGGFKEEVRRRILSDLAACYVGNERQSGPAVKGEGPSEAEAFIELPALQVVASRLWETREAQEAPFSLAHYEALASNKQAAASADLPAVPEPQPLTSPVRFVLDHYLMATLRSVAAAEKAEGDGITDLRLDCLYLLTDGERHRRASGIGPLKRSLRQIRPSELGLPQPDEKELRQALDPLVDQGLLRKVEVEGGGHEYELAHDFAVRAVLHEWRQLDHERTRELGRLTRERRKKDQRLAQLEVGQSTLVKLLQLLPAVGLGTFIWAAVFMALGRTRWLVLWDYLPGPLAIGVVIFVLVATLAAVAKSRYSLVLGSVAAAVGVGIAVMSSLYLSGLEGARRAAIASYIQDARLSLARVRSLANNSSYESETKSLLDAVDRDLLSANPSLRYLSRRLMDLSFSIRQGEVGSRGLASDLTGLAERLDRLDYQSFFTPAPKTLLVVLVCAILALLLVYLRGYARLAVQAGRPRQEVVSLRMWSELVDILLLLAGFLPFWLVLAISRADSDTLIGASLAANTALLFGVSLLWTKRRGGTPGLVMAGFVLSDRHGQPPSWGRVGLRNVLFLLWAAVNIVGLAGWLMVSPFLFAFDKRRRGLYDFFAGTYPYRREDGLAGEPGAWSASGLASPAGR